MTVIGLKTVSIPEEVRQVVGDALTPAALIEWWEKPNGLWSNLSARQLWDAGRKKEVFDFIQAAKSGDMA